MNLSIVIASYNQAEWLPEAIESALAQDMPAEVIVVDDGSTDNSLSIACRYDARLKVISQVNKGLSSARNTGIMNATGDYVLFLDSDDILMPNCARILYAKALASLADVISPSFKTFGTSNSEIILMPEPKLEDFKVANRVGYCSLVKRSWLMKVGGYSPRMTVGYEDLHLWFNLLSRGAKFVTIPEILWLYRTKEKSMWHDAVKHHEELMAQIHKDFPEVINIIDNPLPIA